MKVTQYTKKNGQKCFALDAYLGIHPVTGKKVEISRRGFATRADAIQEYLEEKKAFDLGSPSGRKRSRVRFEEVYADWLQTYRVNVKESTLNNTLKIFRLYILPSFGSSFIDAITQREIQAALLSWSESVSNVRSVWSYARRIFRYALSYEYISFLPYNEALVVPKRPAPENGSLEEPLVFLEKGELEAFLLASEKLLSHDWFVFMRLLAMTGLRRGEALALLWEDFRSGVVHVNKTLSTGLENRQIVSRPKTEAGKRLVILDDVTTTLLEEMRGPDATPIFAKPDGSYWSLSRPAHWMNVVCKKAELPRITPHVLRHTHCSLLFDAGVGISEVQDRLGHEDLKMTLAIYNHSSRVKKKEAVSSFVNYLGF